MKRLLLALVLGLFATASARAEDVMKMAVTTSFNNSGLADILLPEIRKDLDLEVQLLVVGTGQALKLGRAGDVDAILVHAKSAEGKFVAEGYGTHRREIMYNDFVLIGPAADPADIAGAANAGEAMHRIAGAKAIFVSRGDDSGTHKRELSLWKDAGLDPDSFDGTWYRAAGAGMGATLNTATAMRAYVLSDRASWLNFANKAQQSLLFSGDAALFNQYAFLPVNPKRFPHVRNDLAMKLEAWLVSDKAQAMIGAYEIVGEMPFVPNAVK